MPKFHEISLSACVYILRARASQNESPRATGDVSGTSTKKTKTPGSQDTATARDAAGDPG